MGKASSPLPWRPQATIELQGEMREKERALRQSSVKVEPESVEANHVHVGEPVEVSIWDFMHREVRRTIGANVQCDIQCGLQQVTMFPPTTATSWDT